MSAPPPPPPPPDYGPTLNAPVAAGTYANWGLRVLAYLIDVIPLFILQGIGWALGGPQSVTTQTEDNISVTTTSGLGIWYWLFALLGILYWFWNKGIREGRTTQSLGKSALKMHTVSQGTGQPLGAGMAIGRLLLLYVDFMICYVGVLWPLWDRNRQCLLSDKITNAVVYKD